MSNVKLSGISDLTENLLKARYAANQITKPKYFDLTFMHAQVVYDHEKVKALDTILCTNKT